MGCIEKIGNIELNLENYSGEDLYSDGDIEDVLLNIVMEHDEAEYNDIISGSQNWAILYHLSHMRQNIVEILPIDKSHEVLEIGSGCGAITGMLAKKSNHVDCIELSKKRSTINAYRNKMYDNITINVGNFEEVEKRIEKKYDYITLIGVLEYGASYIKSSTPYCDFLKMIKKHLKEDGKIVIAIENKLGLKYFAGCREDHTGMVFEGIEGYTNTSRVRTFSKKELTDLLSESGFVKSTFYYPYPDYKLPKVIYSDEFLPGIGELNDNLCNYDGDRLVLFDESKVYDSLIRENLFPEFSNSFLVVGEM